MLSGEPLNIRLKHLNTIPLDQIKDICFLFSKCEFGDETISTTLLSGDVLGIMNNPKELAKTLLESPQSIIPGFNNLHCAKDHPAHPYESVLCRTNPQKGTDLHLITNYDSKKTELAILTPNGDYKPVSEEQKLRLLGV